jgi:glycosyltransferase involved in cell wall biosynthesis
MPRVWARDPEVSVTLAGQGAPPALIRLSGPRVRFTGRVGDIRPHLEEATVVAVPLRMGSGTRLKVLEAFAMAKPVVSTSLGCEGLEVENGVHARIADEPDRFAIALLDLVARPERGLQLGREGLELVRREYAWPQIVNRLSIFHDEILEQASRLAAGEDQDATTRVSAVEGA